MACLSGTAEVIKKAGGAVEKEVKIWLLLEPDHRLKGWLQMDLAVYSTPANPLTEDSCMLTCTACVGLTVKDCFATC